MTSFGEIVRRNVKAERHRRDWTQADLAGRIGTTARNLSNLEIGKTRVLAEQLPLLCRTFEIPLQQLLYGADPEDLEALGL